MATHSAMQTAFCMAECQCSEHADEVPSASLSPGVCSCVPWCRPAVAPSAQAEVTGECEHGSGVGTHADQPSCHNSAWCCHNGMHPQRHASHQWHEILQASREYAAMAALMHCYMTIGGSSQPPQNPECWTDQHGVSSSSPSLRLTQGKPACLG